MTAERMRETGAGYERGEVGGGKGEEGSLAKPSEQFTIRDDLLHRTYKFLGQLETTIQQTHIEGLIYLI